LEGTALRELEARNVDLQEYRRMRLRIGCNLGDWKLHCHILEHQAAGMMGVIRVSQEEMKT
jgi:FtsP/CotA-like multicopper oxidase with cupredoxin domain